MGTSFYSSPRQFELGLRSAPGSKATTEDSTNVDIGLHRKSGPVRFDVNLLYYDIDNSIYQRLNGASNDGLAVAEYAQDDARFFGLEAAVMFPLVSFYSIDPEIRLFADYVNAKLENGDELPRLPPLRVGINLTAGGQNVRTGLDVIYNAKQGDISSFNTDAYTMVDLNLTYKLARERLNVAWFVRGTNLLDEDARKSTSFLAAFAPLPGRSLHVGVRARF